MPSSTVSLDEISISSYDSEDYRLAQQEWEESLQQLQQLFSLVLLPTLGKFLGRRWSYWRKYSLVVCSNSIDDQLTPSLRSGHPSWLRKSVLSKPMSMIIAGLGVCALCRYTSKLYYT
jgi:hypothetical protein